MRVDNYIELLNKLLVSLMYVSTDRVIFFLLYYSFIYLDES